MKFRLSFLPDEREDAAAVLAALLRLHPAAKVKESDAHPPYRHIYLTTPRVGKQG